MKVLILGSGAREHAVAWKFSRSRRISGLFIAPGNAGTAELGENIEELTPLDSANVIRTCREKRIDLVFVGSEEPLAAGIVDQLQREGIRVFGPNREAARLESSKVFAKQFMSRHHIPTANAVEFSDAGEFSAYMKSHANRVVVKKSGLAAGKGVLDTEDRNDLIRFGRQVLTEDRVVVEDYLSGYELSVFALCDGENWILLPLCGDFKKAEEEDRGENTGGMGAVCPVPIVDPMLVRRITDEIVAPTFEGLHAEGLDYQGVLYFGLMNTAEGPRLLEYNVRFGDPETQVLLPLIESDFANLIDAVTDRKLGDFPLRLSEKSALGVVVASAGYPGHYRKGNVVNHLPSYPDGEVLIFHAGTRTDKNGRLTTGGGRCFTVVGLGNNLLNANVRAYEAAAQIEFSGSWYRHDIGKKFFID